MPARVTSCHAMVHVVGIAFLKIQIYKSQSFWFCVRKKKTKR